jgi:hypothetical protein
MNEVVITLDTDWAEDFMIEEAAQILIDAGVRATWFITDSKAYDVLKNNRLFELGIHPNFGSDSTQGKCEWHIILNLLKLVPHAVSSRSHRLITSHDIKRRLAFYNIKVDSTIFMPLVPNIVPFEVKYNNERNTLCNLPIYWLDDVEKHRPRPNFTLRNKGLRNEGLKVFGFHPIHIFEDDRVKTMFKQLVKRQSRLLLSSTLSDYWKYWRWGWEQ